MPANSKMNNKQSGIAFCFAFFRHYLHAITVNKISYFYFFLFFTFFFLHSFQIRFVAKIGNLEKNLDDQMERYLEENKDCDVEEAKKIRECFILFDKYIFIFKNN